MLKITMKMTGRFFFVSFLSILYHSLSAQVRKFNISNLYRNKENNIYFSC